MIEFIGNDPKSPNITFLRVVEFEGLRTKIMSRANQLFILFFEIAKSFLFGLGKELIVSDEGSTKINQLDVEVLIDDYIFWFQVPMNDIFRVQVRDGFQYLREVKVHDLLLLLDEAQIVIDPGHQLEHVPVRAVVQYL